MSELSSQARIVVMVEQLQKNHIAGLLNKELARLVGTSEANICRDLALLENYKWIVRNDAGRWRLSPEFGGIAGQIMKSYRTAKLRLTEEEDVYASAMQ